MKKLNCTLCFVLLIILAALFSCSPVVSESEADSLPKPKNIIYFVGDGMGYNHVLATNYYLHGEAGMQVYEQGDWFHAAQATYSAGRLTADNDTIFHNGYAPRTAWEDPRYVATDYTDSGAAATALSTGLKAFGGHLGIGVQGDTLTHISQAAKELGKAVGIVSSVPVSHATPAGFLAHNHSRRNYEEIARYMFFHSRADVIMAPGHPFYNDDGQAEDMSGRYVGGHEIWEQITANNGLTEFTYSDALLYVQDVSGDGERDPWYFIEDREDFIAMASGPAPPRVLGVPKVYSTLNQGRFRDDIAEMPFEQPLNENVPTLEELTKAALNVLSQNNNGFFVMIEGGAIDWASHDNHLGRVIEEQVDFNKAIDAAVRWVEENSNWEETLVIVTSDHECGHLTGPNHPVQVNDAVVNKGAGNLPEAGWHHSSHTNMLVPFYAKGPGIELFDMFADEIDPVRGRFLQNTEIAQAIFLMWGKPEITVHRLNK